MNRLFRSSLVLCLVTVVTVAAGVAAEKVHEKPSAFLQRHFGAMPDTRMLKLDASMQRGLRPILGHEYPQKQVRYWQAAGKTALILEEIGKTEPITVGFIIKSGAVVETKVLIYRESHGWEVSRPFFTRQFVGARLEGDRVDCEIDGIVGATLSVRALTRLTAAALYLDQQIHR